MKASSLMALVLLLESTEAAYKRQQHIQDLEFFMLSKNQNLENEEMSPEAMSLVQLQDDTDLSAVDDIMKKYD